MPDLSVVGPGKNRGEQSAIIKCLEANMLEMKQSIGARDAIIAAFWDVFSRYVNLAAEISEVLAIARISEFA